MAASSSMRKGEQSFGAKWLLFMDNRWGCVVLRTTAGAHHIDELGISPTGLRPYADQYGENAWVWLGL